LTAIIHADTEDIIIKVNLAAADDDRFFKTEYLNSKLELRVSLTCFRAKQKFRDRAFEFEFKKELRGSFKFWQAGVLGRKFYQEDPLSDPTAAYSHVALRSALTALTQF
jgi:hypothetical protein